LTPTSFSSFTSHLTTKERQDRSEIRNKHRAERAKTISKKLPNGSHDWNSILFEHIIPITERQIAPNSNRGIMYLLVAKNVILKYDYDMLCRTLVWARKEGIIPWDAISDDSGRGIINNFTDYYIDPANWVDSTVNYICNGGIHYRNQLYKWCGQPYYLEYWIEKMALARVVAKYVGDMQVHVAYNKGTTGWGFIFENCKRIQEELDGRNCNPVLNIPKKKVEIYYLGDADKHRHDMDRIIEEQLRFFGIWNKIHFERIAITDAQIVELNLPENFEVSKDGKPKGGVQLDALQAFHPRVFEKLIQQRIQKRFNKNIYNQLLEEHPAERIDNLIRKKIKFLEE
jgi:hypothetical protein